MIAGLTPLTTNTANSPASVPAKSLGKNDFLKLLVAQLSAQDPLEPMDAQDFSAQLAQFSSLEQMSNVNTNLELIQKFEAALANASAVNLIGKSIDAPGKHFDFQGGTNQALSYVLEKDAGSVNIDIFDGTGKKVNTLTVPAQNAGTHEFLWNGTDGEGNPVAPGAYTFNVRAEDVSGNPIQTKTLISGLVTDVIFEDGQPFVLVNGGKLPVSEIARVRQNI